MAERMDGRVETIQASHVAFISRPVEVASGASYDHLEMPGRAAGWRVDSSGTQRAVVAGP